MANVHPSGHTLTVSESSFAALYEAHRASIVRYMRRRLGEAAAEDAAAEVFTRALRRFDFYEDEFGTALPWLYSIAGHVISERWRSEKRRLRAMERLAGQTHGIDNDPSTAHELSPRVVTALRGLSPQDRETLLLIAWGELSYEEAAAALGTPVGTVRSRIARVRQQLAPKLTSEPSNPLHVLTSGDAND